MNVLTAIQRYSRNGEACQSVSEYVLLTLARQYIHEEIHAIAEEVLMLSI